ncbi:MAG: poly-beta-hydroxybutyrate polymerase N-terminal domain-containing protein, partial [Giesbergeria sp.]|nr:poly-beta-hydroxybutyrate polymerase N-terminal domain-containing protein [Giesbergeria sp.]
MEKKMKSSATFERQQATAKALDEMVHSQLSRSSMGLSPISLAMASADWAMH